MLEEVGRRIGETYAKDLLNEADGPAHVLDDDQASYTLLTDKNNALSLTTPQPVTINRFVIREAIASHSERVEKHALDAWIDDDWKEIARATNVGYKRILRFPEVTASKFRIRVLESRLSPAIAKVSAHYYKMRPPQLSIERAIDGMVSIQPKKHTFRWKPHGEDIAGNINSGIEIRYTLDGSTPSKKSKLYERAFLVASGEVKARTFIKDQEGSVASNLFGVLKKEWKLIATDSEQGDHQGEKAIDANADTYWHSGEKGNGHYLTIDLGKDYTLKGFGYTPQNNNSGGMIEKGDIKISPDGQLWNVLEEFEFGNLINDPTPRRHYFDQPVKTRYIRIESKVIAGGGSTAAIAEMDFFEK